MEEINHMDKFHGTCKKVEKKLFYYLHEKTCTVRGAYCNTHQVDICHCGWEFNYHFGTFSLTLPWKVNGR
jgi:hypothetical protein